LRRQLFGFRHHIYVGELGGAGLRHASSELSDPIDLVARNYVARADDLAIGSLRVVDWPDLPDSGSLARKYGVAAVLESAGAKALCHAGRLAVAPSRRGSPCVARMIGRALVDAVGRGVRFAISDCSPALFPFYARLGYIRTGAAFVDPDFGLKWSMIWCLRDLARTGFTRSPLLAVAADFPRRRRGPSPTLRDLRRLFPGSLTTAQRRRLLGQFARCADRQSVVWTSRGADIVCDLRSLRRRHSQRVALDPLSPGVCESGSSPLMLQAEYERGTKDSDVLETDDLDERTRVRLIQLAGPGTDLHRRHRLYVELVSSALPFLPRVPLWHEISQLNEGLQHFRLVVLDVVDVVVSKLMRLHANDIADIEAMVERERVPHARLLERFLSAVKCFSMDARAEDLPRYVRNLHRVERDVFNVTETPIELPAWVHDDG